MSLLQDTASGLLSPPFAWRSPASSSATAVGMASGVVGRQRSVDPAYDRCFRELCGYLALSDDWDGYGGTPPDIHAIYAALEALDLLAAEHLPAPRAMVSGSGEVGLYWRNGHYCEINFQADRHFYYFCEAKSGVRAADEDLELTDELPIELVDFLLEVEYLGAA
jgi:hypothetical protein